jgi:hypothetical protein
MSIQSDYHEITDSEELDSWDTWDSIGYAIDDIFTKIGRSISNWNVCGRIQNSIERMGRSLDRLGETIDDRINNLDRNPSEDLRDIAESLNQRITRDIPETVKMESEPMEWKGTDTQVKVRISWGYGYIEQIAVKYKYADKYIDVDFSNSDNPIYIQNIIDNWFDLDLKVKDTAFQALEKYYKNHRKSRTVDWFKVRAEWIKF